MNYSAFTLKMPVNVKAMYPYLPHSFRCATGKGRKSKPRQVARRPGAIGVNACSANNRGGSGALPEGKRIINFKSIS